MAVLTPQELQDARQLLERWRTAITYTKTQSNAVFQAIEDAMTTVTVPQGAVGLTMPQMMSSVINTASSPLVLTGPQKKSFFAVWAYQKFLRDRVVA